MNICLGKSCSFGFLCVSFVNVCRFFVCVLSHSVLRVGCVIPDHCLSFCFSSNNSYHELLSAMVKRQKLPLLLREI